MGPTSPVRPGHSDAEIATPTSALMPRFRRLFATPMPEITEMTVPGIRVPGHGRSTFCVAVFKIATLCLE